METSDRALSAPLTAKERAALQTQLWRLLQQQAARYTVGQSTSLPAETAEALLASIRETLALAPGDTARARAVLAAGAEAAFRRGQARLTAEIHRGRQLWQAACATLPPVENQALTDTLGSIGGFWRRYDWRYFAHLIPCDIDYPLSRPVPETLGGVRYVNAWLARLIGEQQALSRLSAAGVRRAQDTDRPYDPGLVVNLFAPAAAGAVGRTLLGLDPRLVCLTAAQTAALAGRLFTVEPEAVTPLLLSAAGEAAAGLGLSPGAGQCLAEAAAGLAPRIKTARSGRVFSGIFPQI